MTQEEFKEYIHYDEETGICTRIKLLDKDRKNKVGDIFGKVVTKKRHNLKYLEARLGGHSVKVHRLIWLYMTGEEPEIIDHKDGNGLNNKWSNLRNTTQYQNCRNMKKYSTNTTGHNGITKVLQRDGITVAWKAQIGGSRTRKTLGTFKTIEEAIEARKIAELAESYTKRHGV